MRGILFISILFLLSACISKPYVVRQTEEAFAEENVAVWVVSHGWHTGIVVPAERIQSNLPQLRERFGNTPYMEFGWGDNMYYPASEVTTTLTLRALLWPTESVIHAVAIPENAATFFPESQVEKLCLGGREYALLISFIEESFLKNKTQEIIQLENGIYGNSQFYQAEGTFYFLNTCNSWTAKGLKSTGMDISPFFKLTAASVMDYIVEYNHTLNNTSGGQVSSVSDCCVNADH